MSNMSIVGPVERIFFSMVSIKYCVQVYYTQRREYNSQGCSQDFHKGGGARLDRAVLVHGEAAHGQLCWP